MFEFVALLIGFGLGWFFGGRLDRAQSRDLEVQFEAERASWAEYREMLERRSSKGGPSKRDRQALDAARKEAVVLKEELTLAERQVADLTARLTTLERDSKQRQSDEHDLETRLREELTQTLSRREGELAAELTGAREALAEAEERLQEHEKERGRVEELTRELEAATAEKADLLDELETLRAESEAPISESDDGDTDALERELTVLRARHDELEDEATGAKEALARAKHELSALRSELAELEARAEETPATPDDADSAELTEALELAAEHEREANESRAQLESLRAELKEAVAAADRRQSELEALQEKHGELSAHVESIQSVDDGRELELKEARVQAEHWAKECAARTQELEKLSAAQEQLAQQLEAARAEATRAEAALAEAALAETQSAESAAADSERRNSEPDTDLLAQFETREQEYLAQIESKDEQIERFRAKLMDLMRPAATDEDDETPSPFQQPELFLDDADDVDEAKLDAAATDDPTATAAPPSKKATAKKSSKKKATKKRAKKAAAKTTKKSAQEPKPAEVETKSQDAPAAQEPDTPELTQLPGVGAKLAERLQGLGYVKLEQIAALDDAGIVQLGEALGRYESRIRKLGWVEEASKLIES